MALLEERQKLVHTRAALLRREHFIASLLDRSSLRSVEPVIVVEAFAKKTFNEDRPGHGAREAASVIAEGGLDFSQDFRRACGGVDALYFGFELRRCNDDAVDFLECGFLVNILAHEPRQCLLRQRLLERGFFAEAMIVIH